LTHLYFPAIIGSIKNTIAIPGKEEEVATPLGHFLVGVVSYSVVCPGEHWQLIEALGCGFLAASPDLDVLLSAVVTGKGGTFHRQFTHRLAMVLLSFFGALGLGFLIRWGLTPEVVTWAVFVGFLVLTHYLMDFWVRLPYFNPAWPRDGSLVEALVSQLRRPSIFDYLIDLVVYGIAYAMLAFSLAP